MKIVFLFVLSLFSAALFADDVIEYCQVNVKKSFSIYVNYGEVSDSRLLHRGKKPANNEKFDDDVLYLTDKFNASAIKLWSNDESDALFYDATIGDDDGVALRFDFVVTGHSGNKYIGDMTYYIEQAGAWVRKGTESLALSYTAHRARALHLREIDDDDNDDLNGLHCSSGKPPVVNPPEFNLDICPYVPNTVQTNYLLFNDKPHGALQMTGGNYIHLADHEERFFLSSSIGDKNCIFPDGSVGDCKTTDQKPVIDGFPAVLDPFPNIDNAKDKDCKLDNPRDCSLSSGTYKDVKIAENATLVLEGGVYYFNILKFEAEGASLEIKGPTEIHYKEILFEKSYIKINANSGAQSENLLFVGHGVKSHFYLDTQVDNALINAYIFVDSNADGTSNGFGFTGYDNTFNGGVTSHSIAISGSRNKISATNKLNCFEPQTPKIARINIVPNNMYLQCQSDKSVYVEVFDKDDNLITDIGSASVSLYSETANALGFTLTGFDTVNGRFEYQISSKAGNDYGPIAVKAHVVSDSSINDDSDIVFAPAKFNINDGKEKELIAGKPTNITMSVLACSEDNQTITGNYSKKLTEDDLSDSSFIPNPWADSSKHLSFEADFSDGIAVAALKFDEAGQYVGQLTDTIRCSDFGTGVKDCPSNETKIIQGELKFKARPWTFAICDENTQLLRNGNISDASSAAFIAAGKPFNTQVLPIRWIESSVVPVSTKSYYCNVDNVTQNFFFGGGGAFNIALENKVVGSGMDDGVLSGSTAMSYTDKASAGYYYDFSSLSWNEVGSLELQVTATANYFGMAIDAGRTEVGRFYPNHFAISESTWTAPDNQNAITYLSQPFKLAAIKVGAFAYGSTDAVKNYRFFTSDLQATFSLQQDSAVDNELVLDIVAGNWQEHAGASYWVLDDDAAQVSRDQSISGSTITSKENGPFNIDTATDPLSTSTDFGLEISGLYDPVSFDESDVLAEQAFSHQPQLRFGRMVMGSSGGQSGRELSVPLRVEYWNGSRFVINADDDRSKLDSSASYVCKQTLWSEGLASDSQLSGAASLTSITDGEYHELIAKADSADNSIREQVRFWLRLDDTSVSGHRSPQVSRSGVTCGTNSTAQPWLQYNWSGLGDEDPSTVATFGIFRGNDKIIFRGESDLIGL